MPKRAKKRSNSAKYAGFLRFFLASRKKIYDNTKLEGSPSCRKFGLNFCFVFVSNRIFGSRQRSVPSSLYRLKRKRKNFGLLAKESAAAKKRGGTTPLFLCNPAHAETRFVTLPRCTPLRKAHAWAGVLPRCRRARAARTYIYCR